MIVAVIPLVVAIVSALVYALATNGKITQLALYAWLASMVALLLSLAGKVIRIGEIAAGWVIG